jgi:hypothetical protein
LQRKTKNGSKQEEGGMYHEIIYNHMRVGYSRSDRRNDRNHSPPYSTIVSYAYEESMSSLEVSPARHQRRRHEFDSF